MKKSLVLSVLILILHATSWAYSFSAINIDGVSIYYNIVSSTDMTCCVTSLRAGYYYSGEVVIPETVTSGGYTYTVIGIEDWAFFNCTELTEVVIPNSVTSIGDYAFQSCPSLTRVTIPDGVTSIGDYAFCECSGLKQVTIGNSVTEIGRRAFYKCSGVTSITLPESLKTIGEYAFYNCNSLSNLTLEDGEETLAMTTSSSSTPFTNCPIETLYLGRNIDYSYTSSNKTYNNSPFKSLSTLNSLTISESVTEIGYEAFYGCTGVMGVTIPNSVTEIGSWAFAGCTGLTGVTIPNSVTEIGERAFSGCTGVTEVTIGESVTSIGDCVFYLCNSLTEVNFNATACTSAGSSTGNAFSNCTSLSTINLGDNVSIIPAYLCYNLTKLTEITIPSCVTYIGSSAFRDCTGLTSAIIPNSVTTIQQYTFSGCTGLTSVIIPNNVTTIESYAFQDCTALSTLFLEDGEETLVMTTSSSSTPFTNCSIKMLYLGRNIDYSYTSSNKTYNNSPFKNTTALTSLTIGNKVTGIGDEEFSGCTNLTDIISLNPAPPVIGKSNFSNVLNVEVPKEALLTYVVTDLWEDFGRIYAKENGDTYYPVVIIREGSSIVCADGSTDGAVAKKGETVRITLLSEISQVNGMAIYRSDDIVPEISSNGYYPLKATEYHLNNRVYAYSIEEQYYFDIAVPSAGQVLEELTVYNISSVYGLKVTGDVNGTDIMTIRKMPYIELLDLSDANIVSGGDPYYDYYETEDSTIGSYFFADMSSLKYVKMPNSTESIEDYAFKDLTGLKGVVIPGTVANISNYAFKGCTRLTSFSFEDGEETLTFNYTSSTTPLKDCPITSLYLGRNMSFNSSYSPFRDKTSLMLLTIGNSVTEIGNSAFYGCLGLTSVTIPNSVTSIGGSAFYGCTGLAEVTIGNSVETISGSAFYGCTGLTSVTIPNSVIYLSGFSNCTGLTSITIPNSVTTIGNSAFYGCSGLTEVIFPESLVAINGYAFSGCTRLTKLLFPDSVTSIGIGAFEDCSGLTALTIGSGMESIGSLAFGGCSELAQIDTRAATPPDITSNTFNGVDKGTCVLNVPIGCINPYWAHLYWGLFFYINEKDVGLMTPVGRVTANAEAEIVGYYTTDGKKVSQPQRGINIIRYSDGTARKVLVK